MRIVKNALLFGLMAAMFVGPTFNIMASEITSQEVNETETEDDKILGAAKSELSRYKWDIDSTTSRTCIINVEDAQCRIEIFYTTEAGAPEVSFVSSKGDIISSAGSTNSKVKGTYKEPVTTARGISMLPVYISGDNAKQEWVCNIKLASGTTEVCVVTTDSTKDMEKIMRESKRRVMKLYLYGFSTNSSYTVDDLSMFDLFNQGENKDPDSMQSSGDAYIVSPTPTPLPSEETGKEPISGSMIFAIVLVAGLIVFKIYQKVGSGKKKKEDRAAQAAEERRQKRAEEAERRREIENIELYNEMHKDDDLYYDDDTSIVEATESEIRESEARKAYEMGEEEYTEDLEDELEIVNISVAEEEEKSRKEQAAKRNVYDNGEDRETSGDTDRENNYRESSEVAWMKQNSADDDNDFF